MEKRNDSLRSFSDEKYYPSRHYDRYDPYEDYEYFDNHYRPHRGPAQKTFDSDYDHDPKGYGKKEKRGYDDRRFHDGYPRSEYLRGPP